MIEINLLPPEYQRGRMPTIDSILTVILSAFVIASLFVITIGLNGKVKAHEDIIDIFKKQIVPYKKQYKEIKIAQNKLNDIEKRLPIVERLVGNRVLWANKLTGIYDNIPRGIWLQELHMELKKAKKAAGVEQKAATKNTQQKETEVVETKIRKLPVMRILGLARSFVELSRFIKNLNSSSLFSSEARLISANDVDFDYPSLLSFEIRAEVATSMTIDD